MSELIIFYAVLEAIKNFVMLPPIEYLPCIRGIATSTSYTFFLKLRHTESDINSYAFIMYEILYRAVKKHSSEFEALGYTPLLSEAFPLLSLIGIKHVSADVIAISFVLTNTEENIDFLMHDMFKRNGESD